MLIFAANRRPDRLEWVRLNPKAETPVPKAKVRPAPYGGLSMGGFLQAAKPDWTQKDITSVLERWDERDGMMDEWMGVFVRRALRYRSFSCINGLLQLRQYAFNQALWWWVSCHCSTKSFRWALFCVIMRYHKVLQAKHKQVSEIVKKETQTLGPDHLGSSAGV